MFFRILKKDLKRKKSMNVILLIFIMLATTFFASSVKNLLAISGSIEYFLEESKAPDYLIAAVDRCENDEINKWLKSSKCIVEYDLDESIMMTKNNFQVESGDNIQEYKSNGDILLQSQPETLGKILDEEGKEVTLNDGEIAFCIADKKNNNLEIGDKIIIEIDGIKKEFTIKTFTKDSIFGSTMNEMKRVLISDSDYEYFNSNLQNKINFNNYYIKTNNLEALAKEFKSVDFNYMITIDQAMLKSTFILDMLPSIVLIIVSICLILITFLILRFTIVFTIQDDFKEIGIMKAIGLKNFTVKKMYLIKYFTISLIGSLIGCIISIPFGNILLNQSAAGILMKPISNELLFNFICSTIIILIIMFFCYTSTRKLNKISAISAIRNGSNGESYKGKGRLKLRESLFRNTPIMLALNDIVSNLKKYIVLLLTFCIGTLLIILPINTINTLKDGNMIKMFSMQYSDVLIETNNSQYGSDYTEEKYLNDIKKLEKELTYNGIDINLYSEVGYSGNIYGSDEDNAIGIYILQGKNTFKDEYSILKGDMPKEINEIAITESLANKFNVKIGDSINIKIGDLKDKFIITGLYESMVNMGQSARINNKIHIDFKNMTLVLPFQGDFKDNENAEILIKEIKDKYPDYKVTNSSEYVSRYVGSSIDQLNIIKNIIVAIIIVINGLITMLMMKIFISKEKGEIAMLKCVGFRNSSIKVWQALRIIIILTLAIIFGILIAKFVGPSIIGLIFAMMGVNKVELKIIPFEVYFKYPIILLIVNSLMAYLSANKIKNIDFKEINNIE